MRQGAREITHPRDYALAKEEMPILCAFGDEECCNDEDAGGEEEGGFEVAEVEEAAGDQAGNEDEGVLDGADPRTMKGQI